MMKVGQITKLQVGAPYQETVKYAVVYHHVNIFSSVSRFNCNTYILFQDEEPVELPLFEHEHKTQFKIS